MLFLDSISSTPLVSAGGIKNRDYPPSIQAFRSLSSLMPRPRAVLIDAANIKRIRVGSRNVSSRISRKVVGGADLNVFVPKSSPYFWASFELWPWLKDTFSLLAIPFANPWDSRARMSLLVLMFFKSVCVIPRLPTWPPGKGDIFRKSDFLNSKNIGYLIFITWNHVSLGHERSVISLYTYRSCKRLSLDRKYWWWNYQSTEHGIILLWIWVPQCHELVKCTENSLPSCSSSTTSNLKYNDKKMLGIKKKTELMYEVNRSIMGCMHAGCRNSPSSITNNLTSANQLLLAHSYPSMWAARKFQAIKNRHYIIEISGHCLSVDCWFVYVEWEPVCFGSSHHWTAEDAIE